MLVRSRYRPASVESIRAMASATDSVLVLFPGALGDFVCFLPTLQALRKRHTGAMRIIARPQLLELVCLPGASTASIDRREIADLFAPGERLRAETQALFGGFGTIHSWTGFNSPELRERLTLLGGAHVSVHRFRGMRPRQHATDYYARCVGISPETVPASIVVEDAEWFDDFQKRHRLDSGSLLVMHSGSGSPRKNWQGFGEVAHHWRQRHGDAMVLLQGPADHADTALPRADVVRISGLSLPQVAGLLRRSSLYLGNDSGISHLAGAVGARGVVVFGCSEPAIWAPRGGALRVLHAPEPCPRCGPDLLCLHRLSADRVIRALESLRA